MHLAKAMIISNKGEGAVIDSRGNVEDILLNRFLE